MSQFMRLIRWFEINSNLTLTVFETCSSRRVLHWPSLMCPISVKVLAVSNRLAARIARVILALGRVETLPGESWPMASHPSVARWI